VVEERLEGEDIRRARGELDLAETDFAQMLGVTVRTVALWESGVVVPSRLTSMVIRAELDKQRASVARAAQRVRSLGTRGASAPRADVIASPRRVAKR